MTPVLFDDFCPGAVMGQATEVFEPVLGHRWQQIFGSGADGADGAEAASLAVVMMMRAYLSVVVPRPPGNVHARQRFTLERLPARGEPVTTVIRCLGKELRRERRYVELEARGMDALGALVYQGTMTLIWAA